MSTTSEFDHIRVKRLELVDSQDRVKAIIGVDEKDQPSLQLLRQNSSIGVKLSTYVFPEVDLNREGHERGECSMLQFFDMEGTVRMRVQMNDEIPQYPGIELLDAQSRARVVFVVTPNDDAAISVFDVNGNSIWTEES